MLAEVVTVGIAPAQIAMLMLDVSSSEKARVP
jgi:hypothetical protein